MPSLRKVILLTPYNLGPYHYKRYTQLAQGNIRLTVAKMPIKEYYRPWGVDKAQTNFVVQTPFLRGENVLRRAFAFLKKEEPDIVITIGYNSKYIWAISLGCKVLKIPCVLYSVGWDYPKQRNIKEFLKKQYVKYFYNAAIVTGSRAVKYARRLGLETEHIYIVGNPIDNEHFAAPEHPLRFNLPQNFLLTVSRLSPEKNIHGLLRAFETYVLEGGTWHLCIAGTGPSEKELVQSLPESIAEQVHWLGWVGYKDLPGLYQASRCFILPSQFEPWGLVVNEAMAAGKPILVSTKCGCQPELCQEGINGYSFKPEDHTRLTSLLHRMENLSQQQISAMGASSQVIIQKYSIVSWSGKFIKACQDIVRNYQS